MDPSGSSMSRSEYSIFSKNLEGANIFVDAISEEHGWPEIVEHLRNKILDFDQVVHVDSLKDNVYPQGRYPPYALSRQSLAATNMLEVPGETARFVAGTVRTLTGVNKAKWMNMAGKILASLCDDANFQYSQDAVWDTDCASLSIDHYPVATPRPDIGIGLKVSRFKDSLRPEIMVASAPPLSFLFLSEMQRRFNIRPYCSNQLNDMTFPFLVFAAEADWGSMFRAESLAIGAAAKALNMLQLLQVASEDVRPFPIFAVTALGSQYKVHIAYGDASASLDKVVSITQ